MNPKHKLSFCIEGAIIYEDCCGISVTINKWLDYLDSLTADIRGVGWDWWTWGEMKPELHLRCVIIVNWLLRRSFQFCFGCKLKKWDDAGMRWWWCNRSVWVWTSHFPISGLTSSPSHSLHTMNVPHVTFFREKIELFIGVFVLFPGHNEQG